MRLILLFTLFFILTPLALAEEAPKYNFATTAATGNIFIQPGETLKVPVVYFFNIYGNRITHVSLSLTSAPEGWTVMIEPGSNITNWSISGTVVPSQENLYVNVSQPVKEIPQDIPEGMTYLTIGGIDGYIPAKIAYLNITVPPDTPLGATHSIGIRAVGSWFGQAATLAFSQERSFNFNVRTITHEFKEEIFTPTSENKNGSPFLIYAVIALTSLAALGLGLYAGSKQN